MNTPTRFAVGYVLGVQHAARLIEQHDRELAAAVLAMLVEPDAVAGTEQQNPADEP